MNRLTRNRALAIMILCLMAAAALRLPELPQFPPGLHYDEAANGIISGDIGLRGERPVFISSYTGKEVLFFYLAGGMMNLLGESIFSLRITAAFVGILTVAATYWLGREMLADRRLAILAAALLAVSFWHVLFSRLGFRAITQPLLQAMSVAALFRGLRRDDKQWLAVGGLFLGLTGYTYLAARLFPLLLLFAFAPLLSNRQSIKTRWSQIGIYLAAAFIILLPLLVYFWGNPDAFWVRIGQVAPGSGSSNLTFGQSYLKSLAMIFLEGDPFWRFNLPGRPLFNWFIGGLLILGWIIVLLRRHRFPYDWQRAALSILIFTPLIMILPTALATNEIVPSNLRAIGLIPFIFFLPPVGYIFLFRDIERRFGYPPLTFAVLFGALLLLLSGGLATAGAYFEDWGEETILFYESDGDLTAVAAFLDEIDLRDRTIFIAAAHYRHPTVAFLSDEYERVKWLPGGDAIVYPPDGRALLIFPHNTPAEEWTMPYLKLGDLLAGTSGSGDRNPFDAYDISLSDLPPIPHNADINFANIVTLLGYELQPGQAGSQLSLTLSWKVNDIAPSNFMPFFQLEDSWGRRWSQEEPFSYPAEQWQPGEIIIQHVALPLPLGLPPGSYRLRLGFFDPVSAERLPVLDQNGSYSGDSFFIEPVDINSSQEINELPQPPVSLNEPVVDDLTLLGYGRGAPTTDAGATWGFELWWLAEAQLPPLSLSVVLIGNGGQAYTVWEGQPVHDTYPFSEWETPQFLIDTQAIKIAADIIPGSYDIQLNISSSDNKIIQQIDLGPLVVEATERLFDPPAVGVEVDALFGSEISLIGTDREKQSDGSYQLTLVWQAKEIPQNDYTVFVHVLDQNGTCCIWQADQMPQKNQYPTSRWLEGEIVIDTFNIILPENLSSADYPVEVGLYIAETGRRLQVQVEGQKIGDALFLEPISIP